MTRVAVLGTGIMGSAMARNLLRGGLAVTVWDRSPEATAGLAREGARAAGSAAEAVRDASVVITTLPTAAVVESVMFGDHVAEAFAPGAVWAQMGTISVEATEETAARLAKIRPDLLFVDAPVSGSKGPAEQGQLLILASGPDAAKESLSEPPVARSVRADNGRSGSRGTDRPRIDDFPRRAGVHRRAAGAAHRPARPGLKREASWPGARR
jgi:3-hydroxyisobutyrate dehydrogenase